MAATGRAGNLMLINKLFHFIIAPAIHSCLGHIVLCNIILNQFICTETLLAFLTIHQRVTKTPNVTGSHPSLRVHQDCAIHTNIKWAFLNKFLPPSFFNIVFQLNTNGAVIPCVRQATVNFRAGINKTSIFCQCNYFFHSFLCHNNSSFKKVDKFFTEERQ